MNTNELDLMAIVDKAIPDYKTARHIVDQSVRSHHSYWELARQIQDHIEGKKPKNPEDLKRKGLSWSANWNFGKARHQIEKSVIELSKKITDGLTAGMPEFRLPKDEEKKTELNQFLFDSNDRGRVASILGYSFSRALEEQGDLYNFVNEIEYNSYTHGYASVCWKDHDWVFEVVPVTKIAFKPGSTAANVETWTLFRTESAKDLLNNLSRVHNKKESGDKASIYWQPEALKKVVLQLYKQRKNNNGVYETWDDVAPRYNEDPYEFISNTEDLNIAAVYAQEIDGSITEIYIPWGIEWLNSSELGNKADFIPDIIYRRNYKQKSWKNFLRIVRDSGFTESGDIHSMRGMGKPATENSLRYNRERNKLIDKAAFVGSPMFEQPSTQVGKKFKITPSQGFTLVTPGYTPISNQPNYDINSHLLIISHEEKEFSQMTSHFRNDATGSLSSRPTKDEVQLASQEVNRIKSAKDKIKFRDYSGVFYESIKRLGSKALKPRHQGYPAQELLFKLVKQSLPEICKNDDDVRELIKLVDGYSIDLINTEISSLQMAMQMAETPFARNRIKRMMLIAQGFSIREVNIMVPVLADKYRAFDDRRVALIENDMFWTTNEVLYSDTDDHIIHLEEHDRKLNDTFNGLRQNQLDIVKAYEYVVRLYTHMMSHIDGLMKDPVLKGTAEDQLDKMKEYKQVIGQIAYARNKEIAKRQEDAQLNNPGISAKDQHDIRLSQEKAQAAEQRNQFKTEERGKLKELELKRDHERKMKDIELKHEEALTKIRLDEQTKVLESQRSS